MPSRLTLPLAVAAAGLVALVLALTLILLSGPPEAVETRDPSPGNPLLGYNEEVRPDADGNQLLTGSGAEFVRVALPWVAIERQPGELDWRPADRIVEELSDLDLGILWVVGGAPCWAASEPCDGDAFTAPTGPGAPRAYAEFVVALAERYPAAVGIELWNEPNLPRFWEPKPDIELYNELVSATTALARDEGIEVPLVIAGPSPVEAREVRKNPDRIAFDRFLEEALSNPGAEGIDAVGLHPYALLKRADDPAAEGIRLYEEGARIIERLAPGAEIWVTELGVTTAGRNAVSEGAQAAELGEMVEGMTADGAAMIAIHRFFDQIDPRYAFEKGFGVIASDRRTTKPAFCVIAVCE